MGISASAKRNRIANYMDLLPEEFEVIDDNLGAKDPSIRFQTKSRIISISCDDKGKIIEDFSMREGFGNEEEFREKLEAYEAVKTYYNDYYTGAKITKNSFEEGIINVELDDKIVILSYDAESKSVEELDRKIRSSKVNHSKKISKKDEKKTEPEKKDESTNGEYQQLTLFDVTEVPVDGGYEKWPDGTIVKNKYSSKNYKVKKDQGNIIEVRDNEYGYLVMARADLEVVSD